jgi:Family of unknown function (DUF6308)
MTSSLRPVILRNGVDIEDPLSVVLGFLEAYRFFDLGDPPEPALFGEPDLRLANRGGARISAAQIAAILERRHAIEPALQAIDQHASLAGAASSVPWLPLRRLFDAFEGIRGVGFAKMTKALHPKRPELIPMLDSVVQKYLRDDDLGAQARFGEQALGLVRGYKRDLDRNRSALRAVRKKLAGRGYGLTEVRILDLLILSAGVAALSCRSGRAAEACNCASMRPLTAASRCRPRSSGRPRRLPAPPPGRGHPCPGRPMIEIRNSKNTGSLGLTRHADDAEMRVINDHGP